MNMLLMGVCVCLFAMAVVAVAFGAVNRSEQSISTGQPGPELTKAVAPPARPLPIAAPKQPALPPEQIPIELLLLQIENHVRLEQAAAESFLEFPTRALLHSKTTSPFVN